MSLNPAVGYCWASYTLTGNEEPPGDSKRTAESFEAVALDAAREPMGRNELLCTIQEGGASRNLARACLDGLVRRGEIVHTPRAGAKNGAVKYGLPAVIQSYMNPRLAV